MSHQLVLDIGPTARQSLANFVAGQNGEALAALEAIAAARARERCVHLWGEAGSGKTHLLRALGELPGACYHDCALAQDPPVFDTGTLIWALDNVEHAGSAGQVALFNLINEVRASPGATLVSSSRGAPLHLTMREDLRTRLGWGLVCQLHALNDQESEAALARHAAERGFALSADVARYLLTHCSRDMTSLIALVDALDRFALERQRPLSLPLVREWLSGQETLLHVP